jgi:hypothetical protein
MKTLSTLNHPLTESQISELGEVTLLRDLNPGLSQALAQCPGDRGALHKLAYQLYRLIQDNDFTRVVFPVGSPAFMWEFATICSHRYEQFIGYEGGLGYAPDAEEQKFSVLFAHSERRAIETTLPDGAVEKKTVFEHQFFF